MAENSFWDNRYSEHDSVYGTHPNVYLKDKIDPLPCGSILFPAEGEGRNAIYAAKLGWNVHAYDSSEVAKNKGIENASKAGVHIDYVTADGNTFEPQRKFDAIAFIYAHVPEPQRISVHQKAIQWLNPGGYFILEGFSRDQLQYNSGGPKEISMLYELDTLKTELQGLDIIESVQTEIVLNEGPFHQGKASVVRIFARKPL